MVNSGLRTLVRRNFLATCAYYCADNIITGMRFRSGKIDTDSGMAHAARETASSLAYIEQVFADYRRYAGLARFSGRVAEVGAGDNCGVGMMFLSDGCEQVDLVDRFYSKRNSEKNTRIYRALLDRHPELGAMFQRVDLADETAFPQLRRHYGASASAEEFFVASAGYDFIVSRAVMEHVYAPDLAIRRMAAALNPGGMLLHKVDLRDHAMFSEFFHELKHLEVPDWLYPRMTRHAGRPNRVLVHEYRAVLDEVLPAYKMLVTRLAGVSDIEPHLPYELIDSSLREKSLSYVRSVRARFAKSLQAVRDEDLCVTGFFVVARKASAVKPDLAPAPN